MVAALEARRAKEGESFAGVLLDYDHFSMDTDKPSEAAGWIVELAVRDDGLWGRVRWTDTGLKAVEGGRYRLVSAVFPGVNELEVVDEKLNRRRPLELRSCALTNEPNIKGAKPIANRKVVGADHEYGCAMLMFPVEVAKEFVTLAGCVDEADLSIEGRENEPHVTVQYGFEASVDAKKIRGALSLGSFGPVPVKFTEAGFLPDSGKGYDVVWVGVEKTSELLALRECVRGAGPVVDTFPEYNPHATLAYVKPGKGPLYAAAFQDEFRGKGCVVDKLTFSEASGSREVIPLLGGRTQNRETAGEPGVVVGGDGAARFMWLLGSTKSGRHCPECVSRHGKVKTLLEWMREKPPYCQCQCRLVEDGVDVPKGFKPPKLPPQPVKNRALAMIMLRDVRGLRNRWSDAARVASLAARLAKYGSMMGLKPWGDSARLAASAARRSSSAPRKPSVTSTSSRKSRKSSRDKSDDVCFQCGAKGHWAYDCTSGALPESGWPSPAALAKRKAAAEQYERVSALPKRLGGYYADGSPVIMDLAGDLARMARERDRYAGRVTIGDASTYERSRAQRDKAMREWLGGVERVEYGINLFNELTAALGGAVAAAAGAPNPTGGATLAFGAEVGGTAALGGKTPPVIRDVAALSRLGRLREGREKNPLTPLGRSYVKKDYVDEDGLTSGQRAEVGIRAKEGLFSAWYQSLKGSPGERAEAPKSLKELMALVPKVTGNPKAAEWIYEAAREEVLARSRRIQSRVEGDAAERVALIEEITKAKAGDYTSRDFKYLPTPMLRMWRDRVAEKGPYSPTGVYSAGTPREAEFKHTAPVDPRHHPRRVAFMMSKIAEWAPDIEVPDNTPPRIVEKLFWRARARHDGRVRDDYGDGAVLEKAYLVEGD